MDNVLSFRCSDGALYSHADGYDVVAKSSEGKVPVSSQIPPSNTHISDHLAIDFINFLSIFG